MPKCTKHAIPQFQCGLCGRKMSHYSVSLRLSSLCPETELFDLELSQLVAIASLFLLKEEWFVVWKREVPKTLIRGGVLTTGTKFSAHFPKTRLWSPNIEIILCTSRSQFAHRPLSQPTNLLVSLRASKLSILRTHSLPPRAFRHSFWNFRHFCPYLSANQTVIFAWSATTSIVLKDPAKVAILLICFSCQDPYSLILSSKASSSIDRVETLSFHRF